MAGNFGRLALVLGLCYQPLPAQDVLVGSETNFSDILETHKRVLVEFYAPWCGHCKALAPEYEEAARLLHKERLQTKLVKVDAIEETSLGKENGVTSFPTLKYFLAGQPQEYTGGRTAKTLVKWLQRREAGTLVISESEVAAHLDKPKVGDFAVIARVKKGSARHKAFEAALDLPLLVEYETTNIFFAVVYLPKGADPKTDSSLVMRRTGFVEHSEASDITMEGAWSAKSISTWIVGATLPRVARTLSVGAFSTKVLEKLGLDGAAVLVLNENPDRQQDKTVKMMHGIADKYPKWKFAVVPGYELQDADMATLMTAKHDSMVVVHGAKKHRLQNTSGELLDESKVVEFLEQVRAGKAKRYYKSAALPDQPLGDDNVLTLTGDTFQEVVMNSKKDVLVDFYAPWCEHCKTLAPVLSELGEKIKSEGLDAKVVIAKMDAEENESEEELKGYPKVVLYPAVKAERKMRSKQVYTGQHSFEPLLDFITENAKNLEGVELSNHDKALRRRSGGEL